MIELSLATKIISFLKGPFGFLKTLFGISKYEARIANLEQNQNPAWNLCKSCGQSQLKLVARQPLKVPLFVSAGIKNASKYKCSSCGFSFVEHD